MYEHRERRGKRRGVVRLDADVEERKGVWRGCVEGVRGVRFPGGCGVWFASAGDRPVGPVVTDVREAEGADRMRKSGVPELEDACHGVREKEEGGREED